METRWSEAEEERWTMLARTDCPPEHRATMERVFQEMRACLPLNVLQKFVATIVEISGPIPRLWLDAMLKNEIWQWILPGLQEAAAKSLQEGTLLYNNEEIFSLPPPRMPRLPLPPSLHFQILKRDGYRCRLCGISPRDGEHVRLEVDHITPVSKGGSNDPANLWALCFSCNRGKGSNDL